ncbi:MAG: Mu-like prophage major head subunit gpT family protein [Tenuifilaceae bacterium]
MATKGFEDSNIIGLFQSRYEDRFEGSWARRVSLFNPASDRATEEYGIFGGFPKMREWVGARQANTVARLSHQVRNLPYESTLVIPDRDLSREKTGLLEAYIGNFANSVVANQWEDLLIDLVNANGTCYDGHNFFDTDHVWEDSGVQKNSVSASEVPALDVATPTAPTPTEAASAILGLTGHLLTFKDNKGRYLNGGARQFLVQVSTVPLFSACLQAISANLLTGMVDNPLTGMKLGGFTYEVQMVPSLTNATTKIRLYRLDGELKPFLLQEEQGIEYDILGRGSDFHFENKAVKLGVNASRGAGYGLWEHAIEGTLS